MARKTVSREEMLRLARALARRHGEALSLQRFVRETGISERRIYRVWDSWGDLREAVGLKRWAETRPRQYSDDDLLSAFHEAYLDLGRFPSFRELILYGEASPVTYLKRFGRKRELVEWHKHWLAERQQRQLDEYYRQQGIRPRWAGPDWDPAPEPAPEPEPPAET